MTAIDKLTGCNQLLAVYDGQFQYTNVYRFLCRPTHGHMSAPGIDNPSVFLHHVARATLLATRTLLHACCHVATEDSKKAIEALDQKVLAMMKECRG